MHLYVYASVDWRSNLLSIKRLDYFWLVQLHGFCSELLKVLGMTAINHQAAPTAPGLDGCCPICVQGNTSARTINGDSQTTSVPPSAPLCPAPNPLKQTTAVPAPGPQGRRHSTNLTHHHSAGLHFYSSKSSRHSSSWYLHASIMGLATHTDK